MVCVDPQQVVFIRTPSRWSSLGASCQGALLVYLVETPMEDGLDGIAVEDHSLELASLVLVVKRHCLAGSWGGRDRERAREREREGKGEREKRRARGEREREREAQTQTDRRCFKMFLISILARI